MKKVPFLSPPTNLITGGEEEKKLLVVATGREILKQTTAGRRAMFALSL